MRAGRWLWMLPLMLGCGEQPTSIMLEIQAGPGLGDRIDHLCIVYRADGQEPQVLSYDAVEPVGEDRLLDALPQTLTFVDDRDQYEQLTVLAHARQLGTNTGAGYGRYPLVRSEQTRGELEMGSCGPTGAIALRRVADVPPVDDPAELPPLRRAILVDLTADGRAELVEARPFRIVDLDPRGPEDVTHVLVPEVPEDVEFVLAADVDRDCAMDLVVSTTLAAPPPLVSGPDDEPLFGPLGQGTLGWNAEGVGGAVAAGDLNGNGETDLFFAGDHIYRVLLATMVDGNERFRLADNRLAEPTHDAVGSAVAVADLDGVADPDDQGFFLDVVVGHADNPEGTSSVRVFKGSRGSLEYVPAAIQTPNRDVASVSVGSLSLLTGDDAPDLLVVFSSGSGPAAIIYGHDSDPTRLWWEQGTLPPLDPGVGIGGDLIDLDGDCVSEIVIAIGGDGPSLVYQQIENGLKSVEEIPADPDLAVTGLATGVTDVDGDGKSEGTFVLLQSDGSGVVYALER